MAIETLDSDDRLITVDPPDHWYEAIHRALTGKDVDGSWQSMLVVNERIGTKISFFLLQGAQGNWPMPPGMYIETHCPPELFPLMQQTFRHEIEEVLRQIFINHDSDHAMFIPMPTATVEALGPAAEIDGEDPYVDIEHAFRIERSGFLMSGGVLLRIKQITPESARSYYENPDPEDRLTYFFENYLPTEDE